MCIFLDSFLFYNSNFLLIQLFFFLSRNYIFYKGTFQPVCLKGALCDVYIEVLNLNWFLGQPGLFSVV